MMRLAMSPAAAALLRSLLRMAGVDRDRILLTEFRYNGLAMVNVS